MDSTSRGHSETPELDALLRAKRLERPDAETLERLERGFRAAQLAHAVPRRRWWHGLPVVRKRIVGLGGFATVAAAVALVYAPMRQAALPQDGVSQGLAGAFQSSASRGVELADGGAVARMAPVLVEAASATAPLVSADFVVDVMERPSEPAELRFTTEAAPETLRAASGAQYAVFTLSADSGGLRE